MSWHYVIAKFQRVHFLVEHHSLNNLLGNTFFSLCFKMLNFFPNCKYWAAPAETDKAIYLLRVCERERKRYLLGSDWHFWSRPAYYIVQAVFKIQQLKENTKKIWEILQIFNRLTRKCSSFWALILKIRLPLEIRRTIWGFRSRNPLSSLFLHPSIRHTFWMHH